MLGCLSNGKVIDPNCEDPFRLLAVKHPERKFHVSPLDACADPQLFVKRLKTCAYLIEGIPIAPKCRVKWVVRAPSGVILFLYKETNKI